MEPIDAQINIAKFNQSAIQSAFTSLRAVSFDFAGKGGISGTASQLQV
jgi:hypothetical protein